MKIVSPKKIDHLKSKDLITLECYYCGNHFKKSKKEVLGVIRGSKKNKLTACSRSCSVALTNISRSGRTGKEIITKVKCTECGKPTEKFIRNLKKGRNSFCSKSCSTKYGNKHKLYGNHARSKFEKWLEKTIPKDFPSLRPVFNDRKVLNGLELDIYFPTLSLAFEINGPTHYTPIYGAKELFIKKSNDNKKKCRAYRRNIRLRTINVSKGKNDIPSFIEFYKKIKLEIEEVIKNERSKLRGKSKNGKNRARAGI